MINEIQLIQNQNHFPVEIGYCINWVNGPDKRETYALQCPNCNRAFCLANHTILNGTVVPSVVCPFNCGYHVMMKVKY